MPVTILEEKKVRVIVNAHSAGQRAGGLRSLFRGAVAPLRRQLFRRLSAAQPGAGPVCLLPVGLPEEEPRTPRKKSFEERTWFNGLSSADPGDFMKK